MLLVGVHVRYDVALREVRGSVYGSFVDRLRISAIRANEARTEPG